MGQILLWCSKPVWSKALNLVRKEMARRDSTARWPLGHAHTHQVLEAGEKSCRWIKQERKALVGARDGSGESTEMSLSFDFTNVLYMGTEDIT